MANGFTNFMNGLANWAKQVTMDPLVDLWALAAKWINKWIDLVTWDDLSKTTNAKIDKAAQWIKNQMVSKVDPTSVAWAVWEWLPIWLANADAVISVAEMAKQIWKQWLKQLPKLLNKYKDAKNKKQQLKAAQEIREYVNWLYQWTKAPVSEAPAYQQKAYSLANSAWDFPMETYVWESDLWNTMKTIDNLTDKFRTADNWWAAAKETWFWSSKNAVSNLKSMAVEDAYRPQTAAREVVENDLMSPMTREQAMQYDVQLKPTNMKEVKEVQKTVDNISKMSNKEFKEFMQEAASADNAWYGSYWYDNDVDDLWKSAYNSPNDYWDVKEAVIDRIINHHWLDQEWTLTSAYQNSIKSNLLNNKSYRTWKKKSIKNAYDKDTYWTTRKELRDDAMNSAAAEAADIAAEEAAYKHTAPNTSIWF